MDWFAAVIVSEAERRRLALEAERKAKARAKVKNKRLMTHAEKSEASRIGSLKRWQSVGRKARK